jgi:hypothetical protein
MEIRGYEIPMWGPLACILLHHALIIHHAPVDHHDGELHATLHQSMRTVVSTFSDHVQLPFVSFCIPGTMHKIY